MMGAYRIRTKEKIGFDKEEEVETEGNITEAVYLHNEIAQQLER